MVSHDVTQTDRFGSPLPVKRSTYHSTDTRIHAEPVTDPQTVANVQQVASQFLGTTPDKLDHEVWRFSHPDSTYNSNCYRIGTTVVKQILGWRLKCEGMALGVAELTDYLAERGLSVPRNLRMDSAVLLKSGDVSWAAYPLLPGDTYFRGNPEEQEALGAQLARLHAGMLDFQHQRPQSILFTHGLCRKPEEASRRIIDDSREIDILLHTIEKSDNVNDDSARFRDVVKQCEPSIREGIKFVSNHLGGNSLRLGAQLVHGYLHPQNILVVHKPLKLSLLDFETVQVADRHFCVGSTALECVLQGASLGGVSTAPNLFEAFVNAYNKESQNPVDTTRVTAFAVNRALTNAMLNMNRHFVDKETRADYNFEKHLRSVRDSIRLLVGSLL